MSEEKKIHIPEEHEDLNERDYLLFLIEFNSDIEGLTASSIEMNEPKKLKPEEKIVKHEYHERKPNTSGLF